VSSIYRILLVLPFVACVPSLSLNIRTAIASLDKQTVEMLEQIKDVMLKNMAVRRV